MNYSNILIVFSSITFKLCEGCLRNPNAESGPIITIGPMMEMCESNKCPTLFGSMITISPATSDPDTCIYTVTATCDDPVNYYIKFNGIITPTYPGPKTLTCDETTMQYTYLDGGGVPQQITSIECACRPEPCNMLTTSDVVVSPNLYAPTNTPTVDVDGSCIYSHDLYCVAPYLTMQFNGVDNHPIVFGGGPILLQCRTSEMNFRYEQMPGTFPEAFTITCF